MPFKTAVENVALPLFYQNVPRRKRNAIALDHLRRVGLEEWAELVDARQLYSWEAYRDVKRFGRKTRLPEKQRAALWSMFEYVRAGLKAQGSSPGPNCLRG